MKSSEFLIELSPQTLASYKKKAGKQASELDKSAFDKDTPDDVAKKQIAKANKRFSGMLKATKKEFEEGQIYSTGGGPGEPLHWYKPRHVPNQDELQKQSGILEGLTTVLEGTDQEKYTGGAKGLPFPSTYEQEYNPYKRKGTERIIAMTNEEQVEEKWSQKYKKSINCSNPKGFSQKAHCQGRKKK